MRIGNTTYRLVFRPDDPGQHRRAQQRYIVAVWLSLGVGLMLTLVTVLTGGKFPWWVPAACFANGLLSWLLARVPPKSPPPP